MSNLDNSMPNCLKNAFSSKGTTINSLKNFIEVFKKNYNADFQALLLTSYGFIRGDISDYDDNLFTETNTPNQFSFNIFSVIKARNDFIKEQENENPDIKPIDNGSTVYLKNVTIYRNALVDSIASPVVSLDQFIIFSDQILGFSLIPRNS